MTAKEYLRQAYRLDHRIDSDITEMERLREMACSIGSPGFEEHYDPNHANVHVSDSNLVHYMAPDCLAISAVQSDI